VPTSSKHALEESMAHVGTTDLADALIDGGRMDGARPARTKEQHVAEFYDLRPERGPIEPDAFRLARALRDSWRRERYSRVT
jgi:hypothetical protein